MELWDIAMIPAALLAVLTYPERMARVRVWLVMIAGAVLAHVYANVWFYLVLDIAVATIIMLPPKTMWQRAIGACYVGMILITTGYILHDLTYVHFSLSAASSPEMLKTAHDFLGWAAIALLMLWGGDALLGTYRDRVGGSSDLSPSEQGRVR